MSTVAVENILRQIDELPLPEQRRLRARLNEKPLPEGTRSPLDKRLPSRPMKDRTREMAWLEEHKHEYAGQWVALDGDRLIAASPVEQEVWDAVKTDGAPVPLVHRIAAPDEPLPIGI